MQPAANIWALPTAWLETVFWWIAAGGPITANRSAIGYAKTAARFDASQARYESTGCAEDAASPFWFRFHPANALKNCKDSQRHGRVYDHAGKAVADPQRRCAQVMLSTAYYSFTCTRPGQYL